MEGRWRGRGGEERRVGERRERERRCKLSECGVRQLTLLSMGGLQVRGGDGKAEGKSGSAARGGRRLRVSYAMSGTEIGEAMQCPVLR